jgi:hypothetical protein
MPPEGEKPQKSGISTLSAEMGLALNYGDDMDDSAMILR